MKLWEKYYYIKTKHKRILYVAFFWKKNKLGCLEAEFEKNILFYETLIIF